MRIHKKCNLKRFGIFVCVFALVISEGGLILLKVFEHKQLETPISSSITYNIPKPTVTPFITKTHSDVLKTQEKYRKEKENTAPDYNIPLSQDLQNFIFQQCKKYNFDYLFILAVIKLESNFNVNAVSYNNTSRGLIQLNNTDGTAQWLSEQVGIKNFDIFNPKQNIECGLWYLNWLRDYWYNKGIKDNSLLVKHFLNSFNCGINGYTKFKRNTGLTSRSYDRIIAKYRKQIKYNYK